jgi:hypothetical protein
VIFRIVFDDFGGADGIRTHDLLDAIEARSQLRHGPTAKLFLVYHIRSRSKFAQCPKFTHLCTQPNPLKSNVTILLNLLFFFHTPSKIFVLKCAQIRIIPLI